MARRSHLTEIGSIAGADLSDLGAGRREGWLDDPALLLALHPLYLALSSQTLTQVLPSTATADASDLVLKIRPNYADDGRISALGWVSFAAANLLALAIGTSEGFLLLYNLDGDLMHKQFVHSGRILKLRFRESKGVNGQDLVSGELSVVLPGVIARFDGSDLQSVIKRWYEDGGSMQSKLRMNNDDYEATYGRIPFQLWSVGKFGSCVDAAIAGLMPPPLLEVQLLLLLGSQVSVTIVQ